HLGTLDLYSDWSGSWLASLVRRPDVDVATSERVPVTTIDAYTRTYNIARVDLLKLDVEGWEFPALKGAEYLLHSGGLLNILFEFSQANVYSRVFFHDFWTLLTPLGYRIHHLHRRELREVKSYDGEWEKHWGTSLYLATLARATQ